MFEALFKIFFSMLIIVLLFIGTYFWSRHMCYTIYSESFQTKYSFTTSCMIKVNDRWIPTKWYRKIEK